MRKYAKEKKAIQDNVSSFLLSAVSIAVIALVAIRFVNDISAKKVEFVIKKTNEFSLQSSHLCKPMNNTDIAADGLASSVPQGDIFLQETSEACCNACIMHAGSPNRCNIWVWHPETKACWLKYVNRKPETPKGMYKSPNTPWTSGAIYSYPEHAASKEHETCIHTVLTSNGNQYSGWQTKVFYETYKNIARGNKLMKQFTRVLHSKQDDDLMDYIPTQRVEPEVNYPAFVIAERSNVLMRWVQNQPRNMCSHLLFVESDYLFFRQPPPELILPAPGHAIGFHFGYVNPTYSSVEPIVRKYFDKPELIPQTGIAPLLITFDDFKTIAPMWSDLQASFEQDEEVVKDLGWVRDMYSFSIAAAKAGVNVLTEYVPYNTLMCQPPADTQPGQSFIFHYTWSPEINIDGKEIWRFDKRSYEDRLLSKFGKTGTLALNPPIPAYNPKMRLQDNVTVTRQGYRLIKQMVNTFNEAVMAYNSN